MNTQTHLLISAFVLARPDRPRRNLAVLVGAFIPDAAIFALVVWAKLTAVPERDIWRTLYWKEPWQTFGAVSNSIPIFALGLLFSVLLVVWNKRIERSTGHGAGVAERHADSLSLALVCFFLSCLLHVAFDFPVHVEDAHRHFWPVSDWRFRSPVSYWNRAHHGDIVAMVEMFAGLIMGAVLFLRFCQLWVRGVLGVAALAYIVVPLYWALSMASQSGQ